MKKILSLVIVAVILSACGGTKSTVIKNPYSTSSFVNHDTQGVITLIGVSDEYLNSNKTLNDVVAEAHKKAMRQLFYLGYAGSDFKNPLIPKGNVVEQQNKAFFDTFWATGYQQFILDNKVEFKDCKGNNCMQAAVRFKLNYNQLRKYLEQNKILNKIGF